MKYFFETYGCEMNIAESASVEQLLISRSWEKAEHPEEANLVIINTCSVRGSAEQRILGRLGYFEGVKKIRMGDMNSKIRLEDMKYAAEFYKKKRCRSTHSGCYGLHGPAALGRPQSPVSCG